MPYGLKMQDFYFGSKILHVLLCIRLLICSYLVFSEGCQIQSQIKSNHQSWNLPPLSLCPLIFLFLILFLSPLPPESPCRSLDIHKCLLIVFLNSKATQLSQLPQSLKVDVSFSLSPAVVSISPSDVKLRPNHFSGFPFGNRHTFPQWFIKHFYGLKELSLFICNKPITERYWR